MEFQIGPFAYQVEVAAQILELDGDDAVGLCDLEEHIVQIWQGRGGAKRLHTLLHELAHAWRYHFPPRDDEEDACDDMANFHVIVMQQLYAQGGMEALDALLPPGYEEPAELEFVPEEAGYACAAGATSGGGGASFEVQSLVQSLPELQRGPLGTVAVCDVSTNGAGGRVQCQTCCKVINDRYVVNDAPPVWDHHVKGLVMKRSMYCDHCHHVQVWEEGCTPTGAPNSCPIAEPAFITDAEVVDQFLLKYPEARGVD